MDNSLRLVAEITGCSDSQSQAVIAALIDSGWTPPWDLRPSKIEKTEAIASLTLDDLPAGAVLTVHTDGACSGNPGPGGWGVVFSVGGSIVAKFSGADVDTTNNRMELTAVLRRCDGRLRGHGTGRGYHAVSTGKGLGARMTKLDIITPGPEIESDPDATVLWDQTGSFIGAALAHMERGKAFSIMLGRLQHELREAYGAETTRRVLQAIMDTMEE